MKFIKGTKEYIEFRKKANEVNRRYFAKPEVRERKRIYSKEYRRKNKKKISEYGYRLRARPEYQERVKKWAKENKEYIREYRRRLEYKKKKKESDKKYMKKIRKNKEKHKEFLKKQRIYRQNNLEKIKEYNSKYYTSPKGIISYTNHNHRRLALIKGRKTDLTNTKIRKIFNRDKVCVYCVSDIRLGLDHIISLAKGGSCMFNNFVVACQKCNCSKSDRNVFYWCKLMKREVPEIVLKLLKEQKELEIASRKIAA